MTTHAAQPVVSWDAVEKHIARLATTHEELAGSAYRIAAYEPNYRIQIETASGPSWVDIDTIQACWATFVRLGRIRRRDVLEPGRCSAFIMALFAAVPGVREELARGEQYLVLDAG